MERARVRTSYLPLVHLSPRYWLSISPGKLHFHPNSHSSVTPLLWLPHVQKSVRDCARLQLLWNSKRYISASSVLSAPCIKLILNKSASFVSAPYCSIERFLPFTIVLSLSLHLLWPYFPLLFILCVFVALASSWL